MVVSPLRKLTLLFLAVLLTLGSLSWWTVSRTAALGAAGDASAAATIHHSIIVAQVLAVLVTASVLALCGTWILWRERKAANAADATRSLDQHEQQYRSIFESTNDSIFVFNAQGMVVEANPAACRLHEYTREELLGMHGTELIVPENRVLFSSFLQRVGAGESFYVEGKNLSKSGRRIDVAVQGRQFLFAGKPHYLAVARDVTDQREAERRANEIELRYRLVAESVNDAIWDWDLVNQTLDWFERGEPNFSVGYTQGERLLQEFVEHIHPDDVARVMATHDTVVNGTDNQWMSEYRYRQADGSYAIVLDRGSMIRDAEGRPIRMIGSMIDLTERRKAEGELIRVTERLAAEQARIETILQQLPVGVAIADAETGQITYANHRCIEIYGTEIEWTGNIDVDMTRWGPRRLDDSRYEIHELPLIRAMLNGEMTSGERMRCPTGVNKSVIVSVNAAPVIGPDGRILAGVAAIEDVTKHLAAEREREVNEERLRLAIDSANIGTFDWDFVSNQLLTSPRTREAFGLPTDQAVVYQDLVQAIHPDDRFILDNEVERALNPLGSGHYETEYRTVWPDRTEHWIHARGRVFFEGDGLNRKPVRFVGTVVDTTQQKQAEQASQEQRRWLEVVLDLMPVPAIFLDPGTAEITFANRAADVLAGGRLSSEASERQSLLQAFTDDHGRELALEQLPTIRAARGERLIDHQVNWHVGSKRMPLLVWADLLPAMSGHGSICMMMFQDITRLKNVEQNIRFMAEASAGLVERLDRDSILTKLASVAVSMFADACAVDLLEENGQFKRLVFEANGSALEPLNRLTQPNTVSSLGQSVGARRTLAKGSSMLVPDVANLLLALPEIPYDDARQMAECQWKSLLAVPLISRAHPLGVISFFTAQSGRVFDAEAQQAAEDVVRRAVVAIENAELYEQLKLADRRKDEFLATLAHELRNPLAPIRTGLELLRFAEDETETLQPLRESMERQTQQMVRLTDDLLDVARITQGRLELRISRVSIQEIVSSAVDATRPMIDEARHTMHINVPAEPIELEGDPARLAQVLANLLNNAAKYTPPGGEIRLTAHQVDQGVQICVEDNGTGIPADMRSKVFEMFAQVDSSHERGQSGLGIGLTLVKSIVEMHSGHVEVFSPGVNQGSVFTITLPCRQPSATIRHAPSPRHSISQGVPKRRILVVDDNHDAANSLSQLLTKLGHDVSTAYDGEAAIARAESFQPTVLLMDIGMPRLNGHEAARVIRDRPWGKQIILVAITGWGQIEDQLRTREAGFDYHLVKPVEMNVLQTLLQNLPVEVASIHQ
jgi:PAS domain S-box-containing protein